MHVKWRVIIGFGAVGFVVSWLLLFSYSYADLIELRPSFVPLRYLCPASMSSFGVHPSSLLTLLLQWLLISLSNAVLYSGIGAALNAVLALRKSD
jgi:hypothetical protein